MMIKGDTVVIAHHIEVMLHIGKNTPADLNRTQVFSRGFPCNAVASQAGTQDTHIKDSIMGNKDTFAHDRLYLLPKLCKVRSVLDFISIYARKLRVEVIEMRFGINERKVVPEVNPEHIEIIESQRKRLGTKRGFIAVKSNCSIQSYVPALSPLRKYGIKNVLACTYQAISGAGKTFERWPEILDNIVPYIGGEEEKSEKEPLKVWGKIENGQIVSADSPLITTQCLRVPVSDGHTAAVFVSFEQKPSKDEILKIWEDFKGVPQELDLPSAPKQFIHYFQEDDRPQAKLDRNIEGGMAVSVGRLREDTMFDYKFVCLSHNTLRGAAGGGVLLAELLAAKGYLD